MFNTFQQRNVRRTTEGSHVLASEELLAWNRRMNYNNNSNLTYIFATLEKEKLVPISYQRCSPQHTLGASESKLRNQRLNATRKKKNNIPAWTSFVDLDRFFWLHWALVEACTSASPRGCLLQPKLPKVPAKWLRAQQMWYVWGSETTYMWWWVSCSSWMDCFGATVMTHSFKWI